MSEDPTRALPMPGPQAREIPAYGRVGPADPHADPATHPGLKLPDVDGPVTDPGLPVVPALPEPLTVPTAKPTLPANPPLVAKPDPVVRRSRSGGLWTGLIFSALVLVFLLVFILQNLEPVRITFLGFGGALPIGVALLLAAIAGLLLVAIPGGIRILQLRRAARRAARR
jgi:uncharacterized integral membrane protein